MRCPLLLIIDMWITRTLASQVVLPQVAPEYVLKFRQDDRCVTPRTSRRMCAEAAGLIYVQDSSLLLRHEGLRVAPS